MSLHNSELYKIAKKHNIPFIDLLPPSDRLYDKKDIFILMKRFYRDYKNNIILYGGQTATEKIFGFKQMRDLSNDLDYVLLEKGLTQILQHKKLQYYPPFDIFFINIDNIPITFCYDYIHDWKVTDDFLSSARVVDFEDEKVFVCSPEYTIMLKFRRCLHCSTQKRSIFGKDCVDIVNILAATEMKTTRILLDFELLLSLLLFHVSEQTQELRLILDGIYKYRNHLPAKNRDVFEKVYRRFYNLLNNQ